MIPQASSSTLAAISDHARIHAESQEAMIGHLYRTAAVLDKDQAKRYLTIMLPYALDFSHRNRMECMTIDPGSPAVAIAASDPELMVRRANGEDLTLNFPVDRWSQRVISFSFQMTGQREVAVDLAQETFVRLYQARAK